MRVLKQSGISVAAVLDADQSEDASCGIFKLPGTLPPEKEILGLPEVREYIKTTYGVDWLDFCANEGLESVDHHEWIMRLARHIATDITSLTWEISRIAATLLPENNLTSRLKDTPK